MSENRRQGAPRGACGSLGLPSLQEDVRGLPKTSAVNLAGGGRTKGLRLVASTLPKPPLFGILPSPHPRHTGSVERSIDTLNELLAAGRIQIRGGRLFDRSPAPLPPSFNFERIEGMMLGLAIGDALGNTSEGLSGRTTMDDDGRVFELIEAAEQSFTSH